MNGELLSFLGGLLLGGTSVLLLYRPLFRGLTRRAETAEDRLFGAWKEGAVIPNRDTVEVPSTEELPELHPMLKSLVSDWEDADVRADMELKFRSLGEEGWGAPAIVDMYMQGKLGFEPAHP